MFQRLAAAARADRYAADASVRRAAPQPDHHAAHAIGRTTEVAQQHGQQLHLARADLYTTSIEATKREIYAVRATLLPALIKALRSKAPSLERQMAIANAGMQVRHMLMRANQQVFALEKAATYADPMIAFLRKEIETLTKRAARLGAYKGREHLLPQKYEDPPKKPDPMRTRGAHAKAGEAETKLRMTPGWRPKSLQQHSAPRPAAAPVSRATVQRKANGDSATVSHPHDVAKYGVNKASSALPFKEVIQKAFGRHDISTIRVQIGGAARDASMAIGARAYATGEMIAFAEQPDLHTAAHEAAHVIQQRTGVSISDNFSGHDAHEAHADRVADLVVAGASAEGALDELVGSGGSKQSLQRKADSDAKHSKQEKEAKLTGNYEVTDGGAQVRVRREWIREKSVEHWFEVLKAMQKAGAVRWAQDEALGRFARRLADKFRMNDEIVTLRLDPIAIAIIGLPPDAAPVVERIGNDLLVAVPSVGSTGTGEQISLDDTHDQERFQSIYRALESFTGLSIVSKVPLGAVGASATTAALRLHDRELSTIFGPDAWASWKNPKPGKPATRNNVASSNQAPKAAAATDQGDPNELSPNERQRVADWFQKQGATPQHVNRAVFELVVEIESDKALAAAIREYLNSGKDHERALDEFALRSAIERARFELERARLGFEKYDRRGQGSRDARATVGARLVQHGLLISGEKAEFRIVYDGPSHIETPTNGWTPPREEVEWAIERVDAQGPADAGKPAAPAVRLHGDGLFPTTLTHAFQLGRYEQSGIFTVHAFVRSHDFAPIHVSATVEVKTERARLDDLRRDAFAGLEGAKSTTMRHSFDIGLGNDVLSSSLTAGSSAGASTAHGSDRDGSMTTGELPADFHARSAEERASDRNAEVTRTEQLVEYLKSLGDPRYKDALDAAEMRLKHLRKANAELAKDDANGWQPFELRGTYLSRQAEVPSGPLNLYGTVARAKRSLGGAAVVVNIRDHSGIIGSEFPMYEGFGITFEDAFEQAFVALCKEYPEGKLAVMAQSMEASTAKAVPTGRVIGFELATTTPWKRTKDKLYNSKVQWSLNLAATALMIFQPELAPVALWIMIANNEVRNADELLHRYENHTLTAGQVGLTLAQVGLDLLPFASGAKILAEGGVRLAAFKAANMAGMFVVMALQTRDAIAQIQEGDITALAEQYRQLLELQKTMNPSDPELARRQQAIRDGADKIRQRVFEEWSTALQDNGVFLVAAHVMESAHGRLGGENHTAPEHEAPSEGASVATENPSGAVAPSAREQPTSHETGSLEITATAVPGSSYKGRGEHQIQESALLAEANVALDDLAGQRHDVTSIEHANVDTKARPDAQVSAQNTHVVHLADRTSITVRVMVAPLEGQNVAHSVMNPTKQGVTNVARLGADGARIVEVEHIQGRYVIQVSDKMDLVHVRRAVSHELAEILARRDLFLQGKLPGADVLRAGSDPSKPLSPHDHGRIAEIGELAAESRSGDAAAKARAHDELLALVEDMGLRKGVTGADERFARLKSELSDTALDELTKARSAETDLSEADAKKLAWTREEASADRRAQDTYDDAHKPLREVPTSGLDHKATVAERKQLAATARHVREERSAQTLREIRAANSSGTHPKTKVQIGGNASLAARDPNALLVDANQRWAIDRSTHLAQTALQMEPLKAAGFGNPYEFADAGERVPMEAIHFWQDTIAAQGPVIDGYAELGIASDGKMIATIHPNDGSAPVIVEVEGVPLVATGFTHENAPGARKKSPRQAILEIEKALAVLESDRDVGGVARDARAQLAMLKGTNEADAAKALAAISPELRGKLVAFKHPDITNPTKALEILDATKQFAELRANDPGHVFYGDEANQLSDEQIKAMTDVVIAGPGGTGISAAEIILSRNANAHVRMIGKDSPAGLAENDQFRAVVANYGSQELCNELHIQRAPNAAGKPRFEMYDGYTLAAAEKVGNKYDVKATPVDPTKTGALDPEVAQGSTYISAMGRFDDLPPPIAALANETERNGGSVQLAPIFDDDEMYVGYEIMLKNANGEVRTIEVTGAASRYIERSGLSDRERELVNAASGVDAPPESGLFDGSFAASARQGHRYGARRRSRGY